MSFESGAAAGLPCDEYPFASTWQGTESGGGDFSRRMINGQENEEGGKALARFYLYNRIIEKDKFLVWIKQRHARLGGGQ